MVPAADVPYRDASDGWGTIFARRRLLLAAGMGALCAWLGLSLSWAISLPAGPAIVLTASALFFVSLFFGTRSRLLVGWRTLMG
ncbi:Zinc ABC transporter, inner membrane permease protein ZnuB [Klebsiella pneumoniae IS46]|nr:Zinc ABC transporter, inner membrane permease protein ZnuB [Klebsiella pneumoniae IS46]